jgi:diguanylate cyclase (GGDEF)-like protein
VRGTWLAVLLLCAANVGATARETPSLTIGRLPASLAGEWLFRTGHDPAWASPFRERRNWQRIEVPGTWDRHGYRGYTGHAWYRLSFFLSSELAGEELGIDLGMIGDVDEVFLNGRRVGATGSPPPRLDLATLVRRFYFLPRDMVRFGEFNELAIHVYNESHFGGLLGPAPVLDRWGNILRREVMRDLLCYCLATLLATLAFFHFAVFVARRQSTDHLAFAGFLVATAAYFLSFTHWGPAAFLGNSGALRLNALAILGAVALVPIPILRLAHRRVPMLVIVADTLLALGAAFALAWPDAGVLYVLVYLTEAVAFGFAVVVLQSVFTMVRRHQAWGRSLLLVTSLCLAAFTLDVLVDLQVLPRTNVVVGEMYSPIGVAPLALILSLALAHNWVTLRWGEPFDAATGLLSADGFASRLGEEVDRSRRSRSPLSVALLHFEFNDWTGDREQAWAAGLDALRRTLRQIDLLAHHDRDTLAVLLADTDERAATATLDRLRRAVSDSSAAALPRLRTSAGVAQFRLGRHRDAEELLREADAALYAALSDGGNSTATAP